MTLLLGRSYELDLEARGVAPLLILFCDAWLDGAPSEEGGRPSDSDPPGH